MSDKQFAGYVWLRTGGGKSSIPVARLLANCSAAVRPRADIKAKAYNLIIQLSGRPEAEDIAALLEDREGGKALMRATHGDPEDVTPERLPHIIELVKLEAGEFAAARVREEYERALQEERSAYSNDVERVIDDARKTEEILKEESDNVKRTLLQEEQNRINAEQQNAILRNIISEQEQANSIRVQNILDAGLKAGSDVYHRLRWLIAVCFGLMVGAATYYGPDMPLFALFLTVILSIGGFWFVPDILEEPMHKVCMSELERVISIKDSTVDIPSARPDFRNRTWETLKV